MHIEINSLRHFFLLKKGPFRLILPTTIYPINGKNTSVPCVILLHHLACVPVAMCGGAARVPPIVNIGGDKSTKSSLARNNSKTNLIVYNKTKKMSKQQTQLLSWSQVILVSLFFILCLSLLFFNITMKLYAAVN